MKNSFVKLMKTLFTQTFAKSIIMVFLALIKINA